MNTQINQTHKHGIGSLAPEGWYTVSQVADLIGRSPETIKRWQRAGFYQATNQMSVGKLKVWVYSDDDVAAMREAIKTIKQRCVMTMTTRKIKINKNNEVKKDEAVSELLASFWVPFVESFECRTDYRVSLMRLRDNKDIKLSSYLLTVKEFDDLVIYEQQFAYKDQVDATRLFYRLKSEGVDGLRPYIQKHEGLAKNN